MDDEVPPPNRPVSLAWGIAAGGLLLLFFAGLGFANQHDSYEASPRTSTPGILLIVAGLCFALSVWLLIHGRRR